LEDQGSTNGIPFLERSGPEDAARNLAAGDTRIAAQLFGYTDRWFASAAVTGRTVGVISTGTATATAPTFGDQLGFVARAAGTPLRGSDWLVHVGAHGSYVDRPANASGPSSSGATTLSGETVAFNDTPELRVDGTKLVDTGKIPARNASTAGLEFAVQKQNLLLQSEYEYFQVQRSDGLSSPHFSGFYVAGTWTITGEARKYNTATAAFDAPNVAHPFNPKEGGWGAWELAVRYSDLNLNYHAGAAGTAQPANGVRGGDQQILTAGVNWYLNPVVRFVFDVQHVKIDRLSPSAANFVTPAGAQIGQTYNAVALRSQIAF
jgi:phosphate-selective porin OprO/OprP